MWSFKNIISSKPYRPFKSVIRGSKLSEVWVCVRMSACVWVYEWGGRRERRKKEIKPTHIIYHDLYISILPHCSSLSQPNLNSNNNRGINDDWPCVHGKHVVFTPVINTYQQAVCVCGSQTRSGHHAGQGRTFPAADEFAVLIQTFISAASRIRLASIRDRVTAKWLLNYYFIII